MGEMDLHCSRKNVNQPERKAFPPKETEPFLLRQKWDANLYPYLSSLLTHTPAPSRKVEGSILTRDRELAKMSLGGGLRMGCDSSGVKESSEQWKGWYILEGARQAGARV